jgi:16S rRNA (guanine(966)-N(2))-methyltransferase RsmD
MPRARRAAAIGSRGVRPTAARVRDALYNHLGARIEGGAVLDLFAGTGALGLEAIRRGAARLVLVERAPRQAAALRARVSAEALEGRALVRCQDALEAVDDLGRAGERFDLILLDPPYGRGWLGRALPAIVRAALLAPDGVVVAEGHWRDRPEVPEGLALAREARYGETVLWFFRRRVGRRAGEE